MRTRPRAAGDLDPTDLAWVVVAGLAAGAVAGVVAALLRPRRRSAVGGYSPVLDLPQAPP